MSSLHKVRLYWSFLRSCLKSSIYVTAFMSCMTDALQLSLMLLPRLRRKSACMEREAPTMRVFKSLDKPWHELIRRYGMLLVLFVMVILASLLSDRFLTTANLLNVTRQVAINAILAAGMTIVIISGGIDLSIGSVVAISGALGAGLMAGGAGWFAGVLVTLLVGLALGITNGLFIA